MTPPPRVIHVTSWLSPGSGGIPPVIRGLAQEYVRAGLNCIVAGLRDASWQSNGDFPGTKLILGDISGPAAFGYSRRFRSRLRAETTTSSVLHSPGLCMYPAVAAR